MVICSALVGLLVFSALPLFGACLRSHQQHLRSCILRPATLRIGYLCNMVHGFFSFLFFKFTSFNSNLCSYISSLVRTGK
jgi:hypothetical protein